jgi:hypothetical protein
MLRMSASKQRPVQNNQEVSSVPAPIGGLNARDPISAMPPTDAYDLQNWIPQQYGLKMRKGYANWATDIGAGDETIKSILNYFPNNATISTSGTFVTNPSLFPGEVYCATDDDIYEITSPGASPVSVVTLSGTDEAGRISSVNFSNSAGTFLLFCSEIDGYYTYDGAAVVKVTMGVGANQVSVGDPTDFCQVALWKRRAWFVERSSSSVWYLDADALYGAAEELDLGPLLKKGGSIAWIANWTIDAGEGIDDLLVICSENGEILLYKGTDPSSAATFGLVGTWDVGEVPKGRRGFCQIGGDLLVLSNMGINPISYVTRGGASMLMASQKDYTSKIMRQFNDDIAATFNQYGWAMTVVPREGLLIVTVPDGTYSVTTQYAMNLTSGAWTRFNAMDVQCMAMVAGWLMFGTSESTVNLAFAGTTDGQTLAGAAGNPIVGVVQPAFNAFGEGAQLKHFLMARMSFLAATTPAIRCSMNTDFQTDYPISAPTVTAAAPASVWDTGLWDSARWSGGAPPLQVWQNTPGVGYYGSLTLLTSSVDELILTNIDYVFEKGGVLG